MIYHFKTMNHTVTYSDVLTVRLCPTCGITYGVPIDWLNKRRDHHENWFCPSGHSLVFTENEAERLRRELASAEARLARTQTILKQEERQHRRTRKALEKTTKRITNGVCMCCNRSFVNLSRHMKTKHPEIVQIQQRKLP